MKNSVRIFGLLALPLVALGMLWFAETRPGYFTNVTYLGGLILLEVVIAAVWQYEKVFFVVLISAFLWAGTSLPLASVGGGARWVVLFVGAFAGLVRWAGSHRRLHFEGIHLVAFLCVMAAVVSALVSNQVQISLLKGSSLFLLFLYGATGARLAVAGRESVFFRGLQIGCEIASYLSAALYVAGFELFGNPNSLGAVMGVVIIPVLLWSVLTTDDRRVRHRRVVALCLATYLLFTALSRAGILACAVAVALMCIASRRGMLLMKGAFAFLLIGAAVGVLWPAKSDKMISSFTSDVIYKGKPKEGVFGSRQSPWQETVAVIKESPWFGTGFGTDLHKVDPNAKNSVVTTALGTNHEHGNSYLALLEYVGLLGIIPFAVLLCTVVRLIYRVSAWVWRTGSLRHYSVPLAFVCLAGIVHAIFEDWLFAVGYYLSVFFWTSFFILSYVQPPLQEKSAVALSDAWTTPVSASRVPLSANQ